jgi:hypothetical protein
MQHHAYYIEGTQAQFNEYKEALNPFYARQYERFGVDEARELIALVGLKNFQDALYLLGISSITTEAQQAVLKLFEEPQQGTTFVVLLPHGVLLPTVRSRMLEYPDRSKLSEKSLGGGKDFFQEVSTFIKSSSKERSEIITKLLKDDEGVKERVRDFVNGLEALLVKHIHAPSARAGLEDIDRVRDYLRDRSPSLKMLLEHLAVSLPVV